ncbi:hypothetical protein C8Q76DRAFT_799663 [Earliella scabrosa]|nr:hypothetical protein C8Q76DRAFT_799663 [Earliella scabrosa]
MKCFNGHDVMYAPEDAEHSVLKHEQGNATMVEHNVGDDIAAPAQGKVRDILAWSVFLCGPGAELNAFHLKRERVNKEGADGPTFTGELRFSHVWRGRDGCGSVGIVDEKNSIVVMPANHVIFHTAKMLKEHGSLFHIAAEKPIKLIVKAMPGIQAFIHDKLSANSTPPKVNVTRDATR